jgi:uncharacterized protein
MINDPVFYLVAIPAILLIGISKGGFGSGIGILAIPMLALVAGPIQTAAIILPILCTMDWIGVWAYRRLFDRENLRILLPAAVAGIAVGALTFRYVSEAALALLIGVIAVGFAVQALLGGAARRPPRGHSRVAGSVWGALSGYTSFIANAGGPPLSVYLLPQRLDKSLLVGTTVIFFTVVNLVKLPPYFHLGLFTRENLLTSLVLLPFAPMGMGLGIWLHNRVDGTLFYKLCYAFLIVSGGKLIWDALR